MSNLKISGLTELSAQPADTDLIPIVDTSDTTDAATGTTKKVTYANAIKNASATERGVVELATQAEYDAGTATGGTSAPLMSSPATTRAKKYNDYAADAGSTDAYAITVVPAITAYATGQVFTFKANTANTGTCTLAVCGLSAINIVKNVSTALETGDILVNQIVTVVYDGTNMQMTTRSGSNYMQSYVYTNSTTWTKPAGITFIDVTCIGGGGGGGGGSGAAAGNARRGGSGGGGGTIKRIIMRASDVASNVSVTVGTAGGGGNGGTAGVGSNGTSGTASSFGTYISSNPGLLGYGTGAGGDGGSSGVGVTTSPTNGIAGQGGNGSPEVPSPVDGCSAEFGGGGGGSSSSNCSAVSSDGGSSLFGSGGGGGGGTMSAANNYYQPGAGGTNNSYTGGTGGAAGASQAASTAGTAGTSRSGYGCGDGGGGGGSDGDSVGSVGGNGGTPGGGGGGGGGGTNVGGAGGAGGAGEVRIFCW